MKNFKKFILFSILFFIVFFIIYFFISIFTDEIWIYGFSYNISRGLVPYRDFNMVVTPLYTFILGGIIFLFGHHMYLMYILNTFIIVLSSYLMYKKIGFNFILVSLFFLILAGNGYNLLCTFWVILLLFLFDKKFKYKDFIMGIIIGLFILTKQTVGVCVMIPLFFFSKNKIKFIIGVLLPLFIFSIYLLYNGALYNFIDYCFLGMFSFTKRNIFLHLLIPELLILFLLFLFYKGKIVSNDVWIVICFQIIAFPIFDIFHFMFCFLVFYYYLLCNLRIRVIFKGALILLSLFIFSRFFSFPYLVKDVDSFMYGKCFKLSSDFQFLNDFYRDFVFDYDNIFIFSDFAYIIKLNNNHTLNKFDLINNGNMGYNGDKRYVKDISNICDNSSCLFVIDTFYIFVLEGKLKLPDTSQTNLEIIKYVSDKYDFVVSKNYFNFYINK